MTKGSMPLVSVGIPTFNRSSSVTKSIKSVLQQTYPNIQLIISDNASTDETQSICEKYSTEDHRVTYIRQEHNLGATNNFAEVLRYSTGEFFMWLGDDDWIDDRYISECVKELVKHVDYSLVSGKPLFYVNQKFAYEDIVFNLVQEDRCERLISYYTHVGENGIFYGLMRRDQISRIPITKTMGGDWLIVANLAFLGKIKTISHVCVHRESNWSVDYHKKLAKSLGLSNFQGNNPYLSIALSASKDIFQNTDIYGCLSTFQRVTLSKKLFIIVLQKQKPSYYDFNIFRFLKYITPDWIYTWAKKIHKQFKEHL